MLVQGCLRFRRISTDSCDQKNIATFCEKVEFLIEVSHAFPCLLPFSVTFTSHVTCIALVGYSSTVFGFLIDYFIYYNCKYFDTYVYNSRDIKTNSDSLHCVTVFFSFFK